VFKIMLVDLRAICQINVIHSLTLKIRFIDMTRDDDEILT